jgi:hypothetical protein
MQVRHMVLRSDRGLTESSSLPPTSHAISPLHPCASAMLNDSPLIRRLHGAKHRTIALRTAASSHSSSRYPVCLMVRWCERCVVGVDPGGPAAHLRDVISLSRLILVLRGPEEIGEPAARSMLVVTSSSVNWYSVHAGAPRRAPSAGEPNADNPVA